MYFVCGFIYGAILFILVISISFMLMPWFEGTMIQAYKLQLSMLVTLDSDDLVSHDLQTLQL